MPTVEWKYHGVTQVVSFANADDAKTCYQALRNNGFPAGLNIPAGYKELQAKRYEGDGILSEDELKTLKEKIDKMTMLR